MRAENIGSIKKTACHTMAGEVVMVDDSQIEVSFRERREFPTWRGRRSNNNMLRNNREIMTPIFCIFVVCRPETRKIPFPSPSQLDVPLWKSTSESHKILSMTNRAVQQSNFAWFFAFVKICCFVLSIQTAYEASFIAPVWAVLYEAKRWLQVLVPTHWRYVHAVVVVTRGCEKDAWMK